MLKTLRRIKGKVQRTIEENRKFERVVVFNHIPKTAGMSFHQFIKDNVPSNSILDFYTLDNRDRLVEFANQPQSRYSAIVGHLPYSFFVNLTLPAMASHITILRDPIKRLISYYHYIRSSQTHYLHDWVVKENISLHKFFENKPTMEIDNLHLRFLCSTDCSNVAIGDCTESMLQEAKENLEKNFEVVGLQEYFDQSLQLTARTCGWSHLTKPQINRAKSTGSSQTAQETIELIESTNRLDMELYAHAEKIFYESCERFSIPLDR